MSESITSIEQGRSRTWLDPNGAPELAARCRRRLEAKFLRAEERGDIVYFFTLTYDPKPWGVEDWSESNEFELADASEACWDAMTRDRHVPRFVDRLEGASGIDLSGRWWSKREFTKAGFVHHHLIVISPDRIDYRQVKDEWGFGRVDCDKARTVGGLAWYVGKYATKYGDEPPLWLMCREVGTVRMTTCSDGFFAELDQGPAEPSAAGLRSKTPQARPGRRGVAARERDEDRVYGCAETIGDRIDRKGRIVTVRRDGHREDVEGVSLAEFRRWRDELWYEPRIIKGRRTMDAVEGLPLGQAVAELRQCVADSRGGPGPGGGPAPRQGGGRPGRGPLGDAMGSPEPSSDATWAGASRASLRPRPGGGSPRLPNRSSPASGGVTAPALPCPPHSNVGAGGSRSGLQGDLFEGLPPPI